MQQKGFTLVELMLAMTFVSILLVSIAVLTIQVSSIYNRGMTLKAVNQAGTTISYDIQRSLNSARPSIAINPIIEEDEGGRLCLGEYSYVWNNGRRVERYEGGDRTNPLMNYTEDTKKVIRFAKVADNGGTLCKKDNAGNLQVGVIDSNKSTELLTSGDRDLAILDMSVAVLAKSATTSSSMIAISFTISTNEGAAIDSGTTTCRPPADAESDQDYCAINQFEVTATVEGE